MENRLVSSPFNKTEGDEFAPLLQDIDVNLYMSCIEDLFAYRRYAFEQEGGNNWRSDRAKDCIIAVFRRIRELQGKRTGEYDDEEMKEAMEAFTEDFIMSECKCGKPFLPETIEGKPECSDCYMERVRLEVRDQISRMADNGPNDIQRQFYKVD